MESRFAHLRQRDNSVSMLRVRMSRRRSQTQKENRERVINTRRQLKSVQELELSSFDTSMANVSVAQEKKRNTQQPKNVAGEERLKQLQRWKERKALEKEKKKREKGHKAVFKTGLYHHKDTVEALPPVQAALGKAKETKMNPAPAQTTRVTRSMKQQLVQKPLKLQDVNTAGKKFQPPVEKTTRTRGAAPKPTASPCKTKELATRGSSTRSANKPPVTAAPVSKDKPKDKCADLRTRRKVVEVAPPPDQTTVPPRIKGESISKPDIEQKACPVQSDEEEMIVEQTITDPAPNKEPTSNSEKASFAPEGFLFQAPHGLNSFKFDPLTPRSADAFLTPSSSFTLPPVPVFDDEPKAAEGKPSPKSVHCSPPASLTEEPKHDVPYFRSEIAIETDKLTSLCAQWEPKVDEESIPEEMRDRMRTVVGQARLLMKERFKQFSGLVDDCEFSRGEKMTTCTDLQGFWDMVYFQVEDVNKKFDALKAAEACGWVEEQKPLPRQRKVVKQKPAPAPAPSKPAGTKAAAKSRLAAAKAAMKARQQAAESTEQTSQDALLEARSTDTVVNDGGFFKVKSPAKSPDSIRRSSRRSAMVLPQQSPSSNYLTPRRMTRQSLALAQTPAQITANPQPTTPSHPYNKTPAQATLPHATPQPETSVPLHFSPVKEVPSDATEQTEGTVSDPGQSIPSISVEEEDKPGEDLSLRLSQSPCKSPVASPAPMPSASLSFTLSPCAAQLSSPVVSCTPQPVQSLLCTQDSLVNTPESCDHEDLPSVDFERYLQPSRRDSLSPGGPFAMESPLAMDVDMESPRGQPGSPLTLQETVSCTLSYVPTPVSFQSPQTAESALLPFTPELKDRIRQSVCPADLMVFTPPL